MRNSELLQGLRSILRYHQAAGISHYPKNGDIEQFFNFGTDSSDVPRAPKKTSYEQDDRISGSVKERRTAGDVFRQAPVSLADIAQEISQCKACNLAESRVETRAGRGSENIRLLVVGDWLVGSQDVELSGTVQFGLEEDEMLSRMLKAINILEEQVFITNAIKCVVPTSIQPHIENAKTCLSFLRRQITLLAPDCICTMGVMVTRALLGLSQPLSQLRGKFQTFKSDEGRLIPLMPTYHPTFLLQNPEMKKAVWLDLQAIGKQMKTLS